jgi:hypothetical protein
LQEELMKPATILPLALLLLIAGCDRAAPPTPETRAGEPAEAPPTREPDAMPATAAVEPPPREPASLPEAPFSEESAQGAANVVQTYYALIEAGQYADAWQLRWESDRAVPADEARFVANFEKYREYHATIGAPSEIAGAAGSLYVDVPVQTYGVMKDGKTFGTAGTVTLRRVNDVPGSTAAQRRWRIYTG